MVFPCAFEYLVVHSHDDIMLPPSQPFLEASFLLPYREYSAMDFRYKGFEISHVRKPIERTLPRSLDYASSLGPRLAR